MSDRNKNKTALSLKLTSSNNDSGMVEPDEQKEIICPYDASHCIRPARLANHLLRCARNHQGSNLVRCPFNSCHLQQPDQLQVSIIRAIAFIKIQCVFPNYRHIFNSAKIVVLTNAFVFRIHCRQRIHHVTPLWIRSNQQKIGIWTLKCPVTILKLIAKKT